MPAIPQVRQVGPKTYIPGEAILGGQLVEGRTATVVGVAAAGTTKCLGVALNDAVTPATNTGLPVGNVLAVPGRDRVSVAYDVEAPVQYSAAANLGDPLVATALGKVAPAGATPDARTIVGKCTEPGGVPSAGTYLARIY